VAEYNTHDRLTFYCQALIATGEKDETGHPLVGRAMPDDAALRAAMQGLSHAMLTFWPDVIVLVSAFFVSPGELQLMRMRGFPVVIIHTESPYQDDEQLIRAVFADINILNDPLNIARYEDLDGTRAAYLPHCYRPHVHYPRRGPAVPELASDLCFIGTAFASRIQFFEQMDLDGVDVLLGGQCWGDTAEDSKLRGYLGHAIDQCVDNSVAASHYRHAKAGINFYRRESEEAHKGEGWAMGPREIEMAACGLPFVRDPRPESDEIFHMLPSFTGPGDASEKIRWLLSHEREREKMAAAAREAVADRTFENNAKRLLTMLEDL
jgi:spore maturation protein CgeB